LIELEKCRSKRRLTGLFVSLIKPYQQKGDKGFPTSWKENSIGRASNPEFLPKWNFFFRLKTKEDMSVLRARKPEGCILV
jgi:hypothetical protein